ncbi:MAG: tRNA dihydrouridine(20/20a) synthase DusA [Salaquimonas sp.]|nr:tRNA dihydrouridine(20/20a) synthase DusA [Salaquimonas sp.]
MAAGDCANHPAFAIAPMMDWTDRHCRFLHRLLTRRALLYTEMVTADAVIHGNRDSLLGLGEVSSPVAVQLGGSDPGKLAEAARIAESFGYDEINLNVGCPSDRVQSGTFGACLMLQPVLVGECVAAMHKAVCLPVTVKCRLGVDDQDTGPALDALANAVWQSGADGLWVHARKAWLDGLSPKQNRDVPPLDYGRVRTLKRANPNRFVGLNGGLQNLEQAEAEMAKDGVTLDGVMLGRAAYHDPGLLRGVDRRFYGDARAPIGWDELIEEMTDYTARHVAAGGRVHHVTRHMTGLFTGLPGARRWRRTLAEEGVRHDAEPQIIAMAYAGIGQKEAA